MTVRVLLTRPPADVGSAGFDLGNVEWQMDFTDAAIDFWKACRDHGVAAR